MLEDGGRHIKPFMPPTAPVPSQMPYVSPLPPIITLVCGNITSFITQPVMLPQAPVTLSGTLYIASYIEYHPSFSLNSYAAGCYFYNKK